MANFLYCPVQDIREWRAYLNFVCTYFRNAGIKNPVVVEIGVKEGFQKRLYERAGFTYIGIDIDPMCKPDILGDSGKYATVVALREKLAGKQADIIFIDGDHSYESAKRDYTLFAPMAKSMIAFHDVIAYPYGVGRLWNELIMENMERNDRTFITIQAWHSYLGKPAHMGTGIILIENQEDNEADWFVAD